ncbi:VOC family protein [Actinomadura kijaniata]|uniref:VOC family protein n=1 Tax=Actinomadura kijaniata TaxID=46161 RepID=UPI000833FE09|nr:VOC family protein [Actinomadura kijaniata]
MTDPLDALRTPVEPVAPDPIFAARLRERLRRALLRPTGGTMSAQVTATTARPATPERRLVATLHSLNSYLCVDDARRALDWYAEAFGARLRGEPIVMEDGRIGHAELAVGDSVLMLADEWPELDLLGPTARGGPSQSLYLRVPDVDTIFDRAVELGARPVRPVTDYDFGRNGVVLDPFGHRWMITMPPVSAAPRHGDIGYASLWTPDIVRATDFYGAVLEWSFAPGSGHQGRQVEGLPHQHIGLWGGEERRTLHLAVAVSDIHDTIHRIRAAGGEAGEPTDEPYGLASMCVDDQGLPFSLYQPPTADLAVPDETVTPVPAPGEIAHVTLQVPDTVRARAFYSTALGWEFSPGTVPDGWRVHNHGTEVRPATGLHGGFGEAAAVPTFTVADISTAITRVRDHGGTAADPEDHPYGRTTECTDNQGTPFWLAQL